MTRAPREKESKRGQTGGKAEVRKGKENRKMKTGQLIRRERKRTNNDKRSEPPAHTQTHKTHTHTHTHTYTSPPKTSPSKCMDGNEKYVS